MRKRFLLAAAGAVLLAGVCRGQFILGTPKPMDQVLTDVGEWIKKQPEDAEGYFVLGRLHAMSWAFGKDRLRVHEAWDEPSEGAKPGLPHFSPWDSVEVRREQAKESVTADEAGHLEAALRNYRKAAALDPKNDRYELALAWMLQETGKVSDKLSPDFLDGAPTQPTPREQAAYTAAIGKLAAEEFGQREEAAAELLNAMPLSIPRLLAVASHDPEVTARAQTILKTYWDQLAIEHYRKAYQMNLDRHTAIHPRVGGADADVTYEAAQRLVELLNEHPRAAKPNEIGAIEAAMAKKPDLSQNTPGISGAFGIYEVSP
jgi:hypothetical protein